MNIFFNSRINANQSLLNVLFGQQQKAASSQNTGCRGTRDTLTISASGKEKLTKSTSGRTHNTSIDSSIDLKSYIASAKKTNQELIENAGTQINAKTSEYMSTGKAFRAALTENSNLVRKVITLSNKVYVDVLAEFSKDGLLIPKEITWEDGRKYEITRVKDKRRAASTRAGGVGERYTCVVDGKEIFLFYEDNNMWFMERAGA